MDEAVPSQPRKRSYFSASAVRDMCTLTDGGDESDAGLLSDSSWENSSSSSSSESDSNIEKDEPTRSRSRKGACPSISCEQGKAKGRSRVTGKGKTPMMPRNRPRSSSSSSRSRSRSPVRPETQATPWREVEEGQTSNNFRFVRQASHGVNKDVVKQDSSELDCLFALLTPEIVDKLLQNINAYAKLLQQKNTPAKRYSIYRNYQPVTRIEFLKFMSILIAMGLDPRDNVKAYWSVSKPHKYTPWFGQMMPRNRF